MTNEELKIETGGFYKTRCGYKVIIYAIYPTKERYTNIHGAFLLNHVWNIAEWYPNGNFYNFDGSDFDIVSEWIEPHPAESESFDRNGSHMSGEYISYKDNE